MSLIDELSVNIVANAAPFARGVDRASASLKGFASRVQSALSGQVGQLLSFAVPTVGVGAFVASVRESFQSLDELRDRSIRLGVSVETMQRLQYAGEQSGVEVESLSKSFLTMQRNIATAASGSRELQDTLKELKVTAAALRGLSPETAFAKIAEALRNVPNDMDRLALGTKIFGKQFADLIPLLNEGAESLDGLFAERDKLGLLSQEDLDRIDRANDAWAKMAAAVKAVSNEVAVGLAPSVEKLSGAMEGALRGLSGGDVGTAKQFKNQFDIKELNKPSKFGEDIPFAKTGQFLAAMVTAHGLNVSKEIAEQSIVSPAAKAASERENARLAAMGAFVQRPTIPDPGRVDVQFDVAKKLGGDIFGAIGSGMLATAKEQAENLAAGVVPVARGAAAELIRSAEGTPGTRPGAVQFGGALQRGTAAAFSQAVANREALKASNAALTEAKKQTNLLGRIADAVEEGEGLELGL